MRRFTFAVVLSVLTSAQLRADSIVYIGAGKVGPWNTEIVITNPSETTETVQLANFPQITDVGCPGVCEYTHIDLGPHETQTFPIQRVFGTLGDVGTGTDRLDTLYITPLNDAPLPSAKVRVINTATPAQAVELPPVRTASLATAGPVTLTFPDATRTATAHTNLIIGQVGDTSAPTTPCSVTITVYDADGSAQAAKTVALGAPQPLFLTDLLVQLGISAQEGGSIQVVPDGCVSSLWGLTARVDYVGGSVIVSQGEAP